MPGPSAKKTRESLAARAARFLTDPRLKEPLERLAPLANDIKSGRRNVSNLRVGEHSYVDLVVEGGGVLGIALVGYTWALEQAGLRFRHIGGASAGAIVALLLAALGSKDEEKSLRIVAELASFDLARLEDGDLPGRIFKFVRRAGPLTRLAALMVLAADRRNARPGAPRWRSCYVLLAPGRLEAPCSRAACSPSASLGSRWPSPPRPPAPAAPRTPTARARASVAPRAAVSIPPPARPAPAPRRTRPRPRHHLHRSRRPPCPRARTP